MKGSSGAPVYGGSGSLGDTSERMHCFSHYTRGAGTLRFLLDAGNSPPANFLDAWSQVASTQVGTAP